MLKNNCAMYFISASAASIIEIVLKMSLLSADAEDQKFEVMMTLLPLTNIYFFNRFLLNVYKKVLNFSLTLKQTLTVISLLKLLGKCNDKP